jgi:hypothetical protein
VYGAVEVDCQKKLVLGVGGIGIMCQKGYVTRKRVTSNLGPAAAFASPKGGHSNPKILTADSNPARYASAPGSPSLGAQGAKSLSVAAEYGPGFTS